MLINLIDTFVRAADGKKTNLGKSNDASGESLKFMANAVFHLNRESQRNVDDIGKEQSVDASQLSRVNSVLASKLAPSLEGEQKQKIRASITSNPFKIVIVGPSAAGKSSLAYFIQHGESKLDFNPTHGANHHKLSRNVLGLDIKVELWDTAGQERQINTLTPFLRTVEAALLVFDMTSLESLVALQNRVPFMLSQIRGDLPVVLILGNKADKAASEEVKASNLVTDERVQELVDFVNQQLHEAYQKGRPLPYCAYQKVSAKTGLNCKDVLELLSILISSRRSHLAAGPLLRASAGDAPIADIMPPERSNAEGNCC
jgi:small GTP-binding protein